MPQRQLIQSQTHLDYQPGMLLHDLPLDDNDHSMADEHELNEEPTTYGEVTALLQQQQGMLSQLLQIKKLCNRNNLYLKIKSMKLKLRLRVHLQVLILHQLLINVDVLLLVLCL